MANIPETKFLTSSLQENLAVEASKHATQSETGFTFRSSAECTELEAIAYLAAVYNPVYVFIFYTNIRFLFFYALI